MYAPHPLSFARKLRLAPSDKGMSDCATNTMVTWRRKQLLVHRTRYVSWAQRYVGEENWPKAARPERFVAGRSKGACSNSPSDSSSRPRPSLASSAAQLKAGRAERQSRRMRACGGGYGGGESGGWRVMKFAVG